MRLKKYHEHREVNEVNKKYLVRLKKDFFVFGEAVTKSNNTCQYVKGVVLSYADGDATERKSSLQETHFGEANKKQNVKMRVYTLRSILVW